MRHCCLIPCLSFARRAFSRAYFQDCLVGKWAANSFFYWSQSLMTNSNNNNWMFRRCLKLAGVRERKVMRGLFLETTCPTQFGGDAAVSPQISQPKEGAPGFRSPRPVISAGQLGVLWQRTL